MPKAGQSQGRLVALQDLAGNALGRLVGRDPRDAETPFGVEGRIGRPQDQAAGGNLADPPPLPRHDLEHLARSAPGRARLPSGRTLRAYWFSTSARPASSCSTHISTPCRMSSGSKPVTTIGTWYCAAIGRYSSMPMMVQTCPAARKPCTRLAGEREHGQHRRRHQHVRDQHGEVRQPQPRRLDHGHGVGRRGRLEADGEKDHLPLRDACWARATASIGE